MLWHGFCFLLCVDYKVEIRIRYKDMEIDIRFLSKSPNADECHPRRLRLKKGVGADYESQALCVTDSLEDDLCSYRVSAFWVEKFFKEHIRYLQLPVWDSISSDSYSADIDIKLSYKDKSIRYVFNLDDKSANPGMLRFVRRLSSFIMTSYLMFYSKGRN